MRQSAWIIRPCAIAALLLAPLAYGIELQSANEEADGHFGIAVASIPDVDGDGLPDVLVGADDEFVYNPGGSDGRAYLFRSSDGGLLRTFNSPVNNPAAHFGFGVAGISDISGDGRGDVVISAYGEDGGATDAGRVYVFNGVMGSLIRTLQSPSPEVNGRFGIALAAVPDLSGDGKDDLLIGALESTVAIGGRAYVFNGATGALIHTINSPDNPGGQPSRFGDPVSGVPDCNGDGVGDFLVSNSLIVIAPGVIGASYLFDGATGLLIRRYLSTDNPSVQFGLSATGISDLDGDGRGDIVVADHAFNAAFTQQGKIYIFSGATGTLIRTVVSPIAQNNGHFGESLAAVPDTNGDGIADLIVGARQETTAIPFSGRAHVISGATGTALLTVTSPNEENAGSFGFAVSGIGDVDGDEFGNAIIGAIHEDPASSPNDAGRAYLLTSLAIPTVTPTPSASDRKSVV